MTDFDQAPLSADAANQNSRAVLKEKWARTPLAIAMAIPLLFIVAAFVFMGLSLFKDKPQVLSQTALQAPVTGPPAATAKDAEIARLQAQIQSLQSQTPASQTTAVQSGNVTAANPYAPPVYGDPSSLARLSERIDRLEANQRYLAQAAASASAAATLQQAARGSLPFASELAVAERSLTDPAVLNPLRGLAEKGVLSEAGLAVDFPTYAAKAHITSNAANGSDSLWERTKDAIGSLISIRRVNRADAVLVDNGDVDAVLVRAEIRLNQGDLSGAVTHLEKLPAPTQTALQPWLDQARARVLIDTTTRRVTELALNRLSQVNSGQYVYAGSPSALAEGAL